MIPDILLFLADVLVIHNLNIAIETFYWDLSQPSSQFIPQRKSVIFCAPLEINDHRVGHTSPPSHVPVRGARHSSAIIRKVSPEMKTAIEILQQIKRRPCPGEHLTANDVNIPLEKDPPLRTIPYGGVSAFAAPALKIIKCRDGVATTCNPPPFPLTSVKIKSSKRGLISREMNGDSCTSSRNWQLRGNWKLFIGERRRMFFRSPQTSLCYYY